MTIIKKEYLSDKDYMDIKKLENICCSYDNVNLKLEVDYKYNQVVHTDKKSGKINEFLCYENDMLAAYIGLCNFSGKTYEINGMTHPDIRRRGLFKALFDEAVRECNDSGKILLLSDAKSESGIAFIETIGSRYEFCEYRMSMSNNKLADDDHTIELRKAEKSDIEEIRKQDNIYFNDNENDVDEDDDSYELTYIIEKENVSVGKIRVEYIDDKAFIYGFGILPDFRRKGYGKSAFHKMLQLIYNNGITNVELDVDSNNMTALNLYKSFGFKEISVMNYYHYLP